MSGTSSEARRAAKRARTTRAPAPSTSTSTTVTSVPLMPPPPPEQVPPQPPNDREELSDAEEGSSSSSNMSRTMLVSEVEDKLKRGAYTTVEKLHQRKGKRSPVWQHFRLVVNSAGTEVGFVQCLQCAGVYKHCGNDTGTAGMRRHLRSCRVGGNLSSEQATPRLVTEFKEACYDLPGMDLLACEVVAGKGFKQVIKCALAIGNADGMVDVDTLLPHPTTVSRHVKTNAARLRSELMVKVRLAINDSRCAVTTDLWTEDYVKTHFLAVTIHFGNDGYAIENHFLGLKKFPYKSASSQNIRQALVDFFTEDLQVSQPEMKKIEFVTDKGANIVAALNDFLRYDCLAHLINTVVQTSCSIKFCEIRQVIVCEENASSVLQLVARACRTVKALNNNADHSLHLPSLKKALKPCYPSTFSYCALLKSFLIEQAKVHKALESTGHEAMAHALLDKNRDIRDLMQLLSPLEETGAVPEAKLKMIKSRMKAASNDSPLVAKLKGRVREALQFTDNFDIIQTCKGLVAYVKLSAKFGDLPTSLKQECETRWNTIYIMLESILKVYDPLTDILSEMGQLSRIEGIDLAELRALVEFLRPFKEETDKLQGTKYPTMPIALLAIKTLQRHCRPDMSDTLPLSLLRRRAGALLEEKLKPTMRHKIGTFLWPPYKQLRMLDTELEKQEVIEMVRKLIEAADLHHTNDQDMDQEDPDNPPLPAATAPQAPRTSLEDAYSEWRILPAQSTGDDVELYLKDPPAEVRIQDLMQYWKDQEKRMPKLAKLARRELPKPCTSAPSESAFSTGGFVADSRSTRLSPATLDAILFLHDLALNPTTP